MKKAYARVSTIHQNTEGQIYDLKKYGYDQIYIDKISGKNIKRPMLTLMLKSIKKGDVIVISSLDRLGRSMSDLLYLIDIFEKSEVSLISLYENFNTSTSSGKLIFNIFAAVAEFERKLIIDRTNTGLQVAKSHGRLGGRKKGLSKEAQNKAKMAYILYNQEKHNKTKKKQSIAQIIDKIGGISRKTFYNYIKWYKEHLIEKNN